MIQYKWSRSLLVLSLLIVLSGCAAQADIVPTPTQTMSLVPTSTMTPAATYTPRLTSTRRPTPLPPTRIVPTPSFYESLIWKDFLFTQTVEDCELPCWQGLEIGVSTDVDVQRVLDDVFMYEDRLDFFRHGLITQYDVFQNDPIPDMSVVGNQWYLPQSLFSAYFWVNNTTSVLEGIELNWSTSFEKIQSPGPLEVIEQLGIPDAILLNASYTEMEGNYPTWIVFIFNEGISFFFDTLITVEIGADYQVCLNDEVPIGTVGLTRSFPDNLSKMDPLQYRFVGRYIDFRDLMPFEDAFGVSLDQLAEMVENDEPLCFEADS